MLISTVYPSRAHSAYRIAAQTFATLAQRVCGADHQIITDEEYLQSGSDAEMVVLVGNDAVNSAVAELYLNEEICGFGIRYCTDDYCIRGFDNGSKRLLILAGGRPRSTIYAVYRYFEYFCNCHWFWDGDRLSTCELPIKDVELLESPRFEYRGIRYFAHRSLHRFQAEHWSLDDWQAEIEWMLKKRLNLFMLRIGMDDLFQKAFPEIVPYPERDEPLPEAGEGYDNRSLFWSLEYRGELRKKILKYAFERDLIHPEDCGTVSHWYSRTPLSFLDKMKPDLLPQRNGIYSEPTGRVWDVRNKTNFSNYFKLTETHVKEYGRADIFHTIGLGERLYSADPEKNKRMKLFVYRKINNEIMEKYPNSKLLLASWDMWMHFSSEEVRDLVSELDPTRTVIFDYTSDTVRQGNFTEWGIVGKFPWVFGIFGGYEPNSEIRGYYGLTNERLKIAKEDPACCGMVLWPELSHGDHFAIEYFAQNAWSGDILPVCEQTDRYCRDRYSSEICSDMCEIWREFMPIVELTAWSVDQSYQQRGNDIFPLILERADFNAARGAEYLKRLEPAKGLAQTAAEVLKKLSRISQEDEMTKRDVYDIARTVIGRYINASILWCEYLLSEGEHADEIERVTEFSLELMRCMYELLGSHSDDSLYDSLLKLNRVTETNPGFEGVLKENASCSYCRSYIYENARYLYYPEMALLYDEVKEAIREGRAVNMKEVRAKQAPILKKYLETPLEEMQGGGACPSGILLAASDIILKIF